MTALNKNSKKLLPLSFREAAVIQPVKESSPSCELFGIMGEKEDRRGEKWNSGNRITGETW